MLVVLALFAFLPTSTGAQATDGHVLQIVTKQRPGMAGLFRAQGAGDVTPCLYHILGWQDETLFYRSTCPVTDGERTVWQFRPNQGRPQSTTITPELTRLAPENSSDWIINPDWPSDWRQSWLYEDNVVMSADGSMIAAVTRISHGPQNVVIVHRE